MSAIVGIDPGETTGLCVFRDGDWEWTELGPEPHYAALWRFLTNARPDYVVCENFTTRPGNKAALTISLEYIGVVKVWTERHGLPLRLQSVSDAKTVWPDRKLKRLGLSLPPAYPKHKRDAMRHVLLYLQTQLHDYTYLALATKGGG